MVKRQTIFLTLGSITLLNSCQASVPSKPNIVFILADDMGYGDVPALNEKAKITTPNILHWGSIIFMASPLPWKR